MKSSSKIDPATTKRVVILRALQLGDLLCAVPAFRSLRAAFPEAKITLAGLPWARSFVKRFVLYLDDFIEFPGYPGFPEREPDFARIPGFLAEMQSLQFDLALQMQGSGGISNSLIKLFGARQNAGFFVPGQFCPDEDLFLPYPNHESEVRRHLCLMDHLGLPKHGEHLEFPLYGQDWEELAALEARYNMRSGRYVCIHPGSRAQARRWPVEHFAKVADGLAERGLQIFLTGSADEAPLTAGVAGHMHHSSIDLAGRTSLGGVGALLSGARLLVCNDTGVSHLAAALHIPSVVLFSASDPNRWAPSDSVLHRAISWAGTVEPSLVLSEVESLLNEEPAVA